jgi:hypothetical protein
MSGQLKTLIRGFHGPRSSLLAITEQISSSGIVDPLLPPVSGTARPRSGLKGIRLSDLFGAIQNEYGQMQCGNGIVHRTVEPNAVALIPAELRGRLTQSQLATFRDQAYRQHEAAILSYGALSAIEQLLRSLASHVGIHHLNSDGTPKSVGYWLDDTRLGLAPGLLALLQELYSANGPNLRNRVMHAGLLETSSRSLEVILAANLSGRDPTPSKDPYVAENLLKVFMRDLEELDAHVDATGINTSDFSWAASLWLSPVRSRSVIGFDAIYSILMKARPGGLNCSALLIGLFHVLPPTAEWPGWTSSSLTTA